MWRLLLQAGLGFATLNVGRHVGRLKRLAVAFAIAGVFALLGLGVLLAALVLLLEPGFGAPAAAGMVGGGALVLGLLVAWIGTWEPRRRAAPAPIASRISTELKAAGSALSSSGGAAIPGARKARGLNIVLIATLAGIVLGRKL